MSHLLAALKFLGELFGIISKVQDAKNTPEMKEAAKAQTQVDAQSRAEKAVAAKDEKTTRKLLAE